MTDGTVVAWLALAVSTATFAWKFIETYIRWPRIGVVMRQTVEVGTPTSRDKFDLIVVNNGAEAASIANVGIRSEDRSGTIDVQQERDSGAEILGPDLPARVEAHGALRWEIGFDLVDRFPRGTNLIGYAERYRIYRKYPRSRRTQFRIHETVHPHAKN